MSASRKAPFAPKTRAVDRTSSALIPSAPGATAAEFTREMTWLSAVIDARFRHHFAREAESVNPMELPAPAIDPRASRFGKLVAEFAPTWSERLLVALALAPLVAPHALDVFFIRNEKIDRGFTEFGGVKGVHHAGFLPTGETALFLLCGDAVDRRLAAAALLDPEHPLFHRGILRLAPSQPDEPSWSAALAFSPAHFRYLVTGEEPRPELGAAFPARRITTNLQWDDLVLDPMTIAEIRQVAIWAKHETMLLRDWGLERHVRPGFRALFYGPSGTGKTLTATLLGQELGVDVYRVDLSQVISKYIGETEKNLSTVFAEAGRRNWILFFDEADALFGKRTQTSSSHDRYANQEVAYLLQRIEEHAGIAILATNLRSNLDDAFSRRFQSMIYFAPPDAAHRLRLWQGALGSKVPLDPSVRLDQIARQHELTGGQIVNAVRHACLTVVGEGARAVRPEHLLAAIERERHK